MLNLHNDPEKNYRISSIYKNNILTLAISSKPPNRSNQNLEQNQVGMITVGPCARYI